MVTGAQSLLRRCSVLKLAVVRVDASLSAGMTATRVRGDQHRDIRNVSQQQIKLNKTPPLLFPINLMFKYYTVIRRVQARPIFTMAQSTLGQIKVPHVA